MEVDMALVRRTAVGRAQVPGALPVPPAPIPHQGGATSVPGQEMAAAVPSRPAKAWATMAGLGLAGIGALGAWDINTFAAPTTFHVDNQMTVFVALLVFAGAVERLLEPFTRFMPGRKEQELYEKAVADIDNGVPGAMNAGFAGHPRLGHRDLRGHAPVRGRRLLPAAAHLGRSRLARHSGVGRRTGDRPHRGQRDQAPARPDHPGPARL
jgi:hypothetical protein